MKIFKCFSVFAKAQFTYKLGKIVYVFVKRIQKTLISAFEIIKLYATIRILVITSYTAVPK